MVRIATVKRKLQQLSVLSLLLLAACSPVDIRDYASNQPAFDLFNFFSGQTRGWGIVQDRRGNLLRQFVVDIEGNINGEGELVLLETFNWNDGETSRRIWTISRVGSHDYRGQAADVIGTAEGTAYGNALNWHYSLELPVKNRTLTFRFDDWMFLQPDNILVNRAVMSKFGFRVGEITIAFMKPERGGME